MTGSPLLQVRGLSVVFDGFQALTGLDFAVGAGELPFLIGPNGAGNTTLMLSVEGLDVAYGRAQALFGVDLQVPAGSLVCVMGRNGVGKTTLLKAVMGVLRPRAGRVVFDGEDLTRARPHERVRLGLGYVPQGHETFPQLTVWENLQVALEAVPRPAAGARGAGARGAGAVDEALDLFPALRGLLRS